MIRLRLEWHTLNDDEKLGRFNRNKSQSEWRTIRDHPYKTLIAGKINLSVKDPFESMYLLHINGKENLGIKKIKNPKTFIDYSQTTDDVYDNLKD